MIIDDKRGMNAQDRKIKQFPTQISADAKRYMIISMVAKGMKYSDIVDTCVGEWGLSLKTVQNIVNETIQYMRSDEAKETLIAMNTERLDNIISDSMNDKDRRSAIKAIDIQNKMAGAYTEKVKIEGDDEINLNFIF